LFVTDIPRLSNMDDTPVFTIRTVVQETGIAPATLRAWERRYNCLAPGRSGGGYRLYSERDIAVLQWLKRQVDVGVSISRAVALLEMRQQATDRAEPSSEPSQFPAAFAGIRSAETVVEDLVAALLSFQETRADSILSEAFSLYPVEVVGESVIGAALVEMGEAWHRGEATVVQEHFATAFLRRRLTALLQTYAQPASRPLAVTGSAPSEWHEIGILLVSLALRRAGWRVIYLGQNVPAEHLLEEVRGLQPDLVCLSATTRESALALLPVYTGLAALPDPRPHLVLGGRAFQSYPELHSLLADAHILPNARAVVSRFASR
jgi:methanogenic corrinoid protein MtbC1